MDGRLMLVEARLLEKKGTLTCGRNHSGLNKNEKKTRHKGGGSEGGSNEKLPQESEGRRCTSSRGGVGDKRGQKELKKPQNEGMVGKV